MGYELTDPAAEIANVITVLREQPASNDPTYTIFQRAIGQNLSPGDYWHLISTLRYRVQRVERFIQSVDESEFRHPNQRKRLLAAVANFSRAFDPSQQAAPWQATLSRDINADDGLQLGIFSYVARRLWPLRRLSEADRKKVMEQIESVLADIDKNTDVPDWAKVPLVDGLVRLQLTLKYLLFFGYEAAIMELQNLYQKTASVEDIILAAQPDNIVPARSDNAARPKSILRVLEVVALIGALLNLPDQNMTAFDRYQGLYLRAIMSSPRLPKPEKLYLPSPSAIQSEGQSEEEDSPSQ